MNRYIMCERCPTIIPATEVCVGSCGFECLVTRRLCDECKELEKARRNYNGVIEKEE